jgi:spiro-SPASM protein
MNALAILYGGELNDYAFRDLGGGKCAFTLALKHCLSFPGVSKVALLVNEEFDAEKLPANVEGIELVRRPSWNTKNYLHTIASQCETYEAAYVAWADCPFLDGALAAKIAKRHIEYAAEYSYADGWPQGIAPELLNASTAAFLLKLNGESEEPVKRDTLFSVLQRDINSFDIETEISDVDLRAYRITLAADNKRNTLLLKRFIESGWVDYNSAEKLILEKPQLLRTLPAFFPIMVTDKCPPPSMAGGTCAICPHSRGLSKDIAKDGKEMSLSTFNGIIERIAEFADDAVIDLSFWGELSMHCQKIELIEAVLKHDKLSLIIETCGIGWSSADIEKIAALVANVRRAQPTLSWIVSFDGATDINNSEKNEFVKNLLPHFGNDVYVQALRYKGNEEDIEKFYRTWKEQNVNVIIQKYDYFCAREPDIRAGDIRPVIRNACWHIMRDMPILIDGSVPFCRETIVRKKREKNDIIGNIISESPDVIWERGDSLYKKHCDNQYGKFCEVCDEYYTYNF